MSEEKFEKSTAAGVVGVREFREDDVPLKVRWINDSENNRYLHYDLPMEEEKTRQWFRKKAANRFDGTIELDGTPIGLIGLLGVADGTAEYYVLLGEREHSGKGVAKAASELVLRIGKEKLGLTSVYLRTEVENVGAQRLFERVGFVKLRLEKDSATNRGRSVDRFYYEKTL